MPAATTVTANFSAPYADGDERLRKRSYAAGAVVTISANSPPTGEAFQDRTGATSANVRASTTALTMPAANTKACLPIVVTFGNRPEVADATPCFEASDRRTGSELRSSLATSSLSSRRSHSSGLGWIPPPLCQVLKMHDKI